MLFDKAAAPVFGPIYAHFKQQNQRTIPIYYTQRSQAKLKPVSQVTQTQPEPFIKMKNNSK